MWIVMRKCEFDIEAVEAISGVKVKLNVIGLPPFYAAVFDTYEEAWAWESEYESANPRNLAELRERK